MRKSMSTKSGLFVTSFSTTFPVNRRGILNYLKSNVGLKWDLPSGEFVITDDNLELIAENVRLSKFYKNNCYIVNDVLLKIN